MSGEVLNYGPDDARTSGWSGSETSRARAEREDTGGVTGFRQREIHRLLSDAGPHGITDREVQRVLGVGHGASSAALTALHKAGHIARLMQERRGNQVYVLPEHVDHRLVSPYRSNSRRSVALAEVRQALASVNFDASEEDVEVQVTFLEQLGIEVRR